MNARLKFALGVALAAMLAVAGASAADVRPGAREGDGRARLYAPARWREDVRDYRFSRRGRGYEEEYRTGNCEVKRELNDDGDYNEEVHCERR
jgi:hypothetical protein